MELSMITDWKTLKSFQEVKTLKDFGIPQKEKKQDKR